MAVGIEKQKVGFKFGQHRLTVLKKISQVDFRGRSYRLVRVKTQDELEYISIRLYNAQGKFIKQFLVEPEIAGLIFKGIEN
jgi:hypothetical protein